MHKTKRSRLHNTPSKSEHSETQEIVRVASASSNTNDYSLAFLVTRHAVSKKVFRVLAKRRRTLPSVAAALAVRFQHGRESAATFTFPNCDTFRFAMPFTIILIFKPGVIWSFHVRSSGGHFVSWEVHKVNIEDVSRHGFEVWREHWPAKNNNDKKKLYSTL